MDRVQTIKCTHVDAQVSLGFYDAEGNLVREEVFPQSGGSPATARLFHPHEEQLRLLLAACVQQAWGKIRPAGPQEPLLVPPDGPQGSLGGSPQGIDPGLPGGLSELADQPASLTK